MENLLLAAHGLGYGAIWCGIHQDHGRERSMRQCCLLPEHIAPFALALVGKAAHPTPLMDRFDPNKIHYNTWQDRKPQDNKPGDNRPRPYRF